MTVRAILITACAALLTLAGGCIPVIEQPRPASGEGAPAILSVISPNGAVSVEEGLFDKYGVAGMAQTFTHAQISRLPQAALPASFPLGTATHSWSGPKLSTVLTAAGARGAGARLTGFDGYQIEVSASQIERFEPVLAHSVDGRPLAIGELGPFILIWPRTNTPELADMNDDLWVWGVFVIEPV